MTLQLMCDGWKHVSVTLRAGGGGTTKRAALCLIAAILFTTVCGLACNGPDLRTAPTANKDEGADTVTGQTAESSGSTQPIRAEQVPESDIPAPSGELLGLATGCTVRVVGDDFQGSGVIVHRKDNEIFVLTVAHAVKLGMPERIELFSLLSYPKPEAILEQIELISKEDRADLAMLKAKLNTEVEITVAPLAKLEQPDFAYSSGCVGAKPPKPIGEQILRADEITIRLHGALEKRFMWETSRPQEAGRSGGPLLNDKGSLLGIALGRSGGYGYYAHLREISKYFIDNGLAGLVTCPELLSIHQERM